MSLNKILHIYDDDGGAPDFLPGAEQTNGTIVFGGISVSGLGLTTAGVADALNKRFMTDAQKASLIDLAGTLQPIEAALVALQTAGTLELLLQHNAAIDMNAAPAQTICTVPAATKYTVTKIILSGPSLNLTTVSLSIGWTAAAYADMIANATHVALVAAASYEILVPKPGSLIGGAGAVLKLLCNTLQGAPATCAVDVYGILS